MLIKLARNKQARCRGVKKDFGSSGACGDIAGQIRQMRGGSLVEEDRRQQAFSVTYTNVSDTRTVFIQRASAPVPLLHRAKEGSNKYLQEKLPMFKYCISSTCTL